MCAMMARRVLVKRCFVGLSRGFQKFKEPFVRFFMLAPSLLRGRQEKELTECRKF